MFFLIPVTGNISQYPMGTCWLALGTICLFKPQRIWSPGKVLPARGKHQLGQLGMILSDADHQPVSLLTIIHPDWTHVMCCNHQQHWMILDDHIKLNHITILYEHQRYTSDGNDKVMDSTTWYHEPCGKKIRIFHAPVVRVALSCDGSWFSRPTEVENLGHPALIPGNWYVWFMKLRWVIWISLNGINMYICTRTGNI